MGGFLEFPKFWFIKNITHYTKLGSNGVYGCVMFLGFLNFYFSKKSVIRHAANHRFTPTKA